MADVGSGQHDLNRAPRRWTLRVAMLVGALVLLAGGALYGLGLVSLHRHVGYFAPAFTPDGRAIVVVERRTYGVAWGFGWEFFTPPAHSHAFSDELRLLRVSLDDGRVAMLEYWPDTPVTGRTMSGYRGGLFVYLQAGLRVRADGAIEYGFELALPRVPTSEVHSLHGVWSPDAAQRRRGEWDRPPRTAVPLSEPSIVDTRELFALPGEEAFPSAIVLLDHATQQIRIAIAAPVFRSLYPGGPAVDALMQVSRKAQHDRVQAMTRIQREREALYRSQGMPEGEATLKAYRDLAQLGYLPRPPRWVARRLSAAEVAARASTLRFDIEAMEFKVGLLPDIAQAIARPGAEIDHDGSRYITHRDYSNAARINAALDSGATELVIGYGGDAYLLTLLPRMEATRK